MQNPAIDFVTLGNLGKDYKEAQLAGNRERTLAELGQGASVSDVATKLFQAGDVQGGLSLANLANTQAQQEWNRTYQGGMLDVARQTANKPQIIGSAETGYYALGPNGQPVGGAPQMPAPSGGFNDPPAASGAAPAPRANGPQPLIPAVRRADSIPAQVMERRQAVISQGGNPDSQTNRAFILTGRLPREDQQPLTATDKKAILEADQAVMSNRSAIEALRAARALNQSGNVHQGWLAGERAVAGNNLPDWMVPDRIASPSSSADTVNYDNLVLGQALSQLKSIFGGAPTEGERKVLLELQASTSKPKAVREEILARAQGLAETRLKFNQDRATEMRGGTFYRQPGAEPPGTGRGVAAPVTAPSPQGNAPAPQGNAPTQAHVQALRGNPRLSEEFDEKFGVGSAARILGVTR